MQPIQSSRAHRLIQSIGSLWFAAVLMSLLLLAMACATVFESSHGRDRALDTFYRAWWFRSLLVLLGANILATLVIRYPFSRRQIGFVVTHVAILLILVGAWVTREFAVDATLGIAEGQSETYASVDRPTLTVLDEQSGNRETLDLKGAIGSQFHARVDLTAGLHVGDAQILVDRYLPDTVLREKVTNDAAQGRPAAQVTLADGSSSESVWLFSDQPVALGRVTAVYRLFENDEEFAAYIRPEASEQSQSVGSVRLSIGGKDYEIPVEACMKNATEVGKTGVTARVLRFLPHATVGADNKLVNASPRPKNPAIEVELTQDGATEKRIAFARFPDFGSMHAKKQPMDIKVVFAYAAQHAPRVPIEVLSTPGGALNVRFASEEANAVLKEVRPGDTIETPWPGKRLTVSQVLNRAIRSQEVIPADPVRETRVPAVHVSVATSKASEELWVRTGQTARIVADGKRLQLAFGDQRIPLGFSVKLDRFRIGHYPGTQRPRSFESQVTITDPATSVAQTRMISMNHPTSYGGYTLYQSSYRMGPGGTMSFLSVSRDPGQIIVFVGYIGTIVGMLLVLSLRVREKSNSQAVPSLADGGLGRSHQVSNDRIVAAVSADHRNNTNRKEFASGAPRPVPLSRDLGRRGERKKCKQ